MSLLLAQIILLLLVDRLVKEDMERKEEGGQLLVLCYYQHVVLQPQVERMNGYPIVVTLWLLIPDSLLCVDYITS